jgi:hypothetical protein
VGPYPCGNRFASPKNKENPLAARVSVSSREIFRAVRSGMAEVFSRLRGLSVIGFSIYVAFEAAEAPIGPDDVLLRDTMDVIRDVLLVPVSIAIYRLLILGEVTSRYRFALDTSPRFQRIAGWTILLSALYAIPLLALSQFALSLLTPSNSSHTIALLVAGIAAIVASFAVAVRMAIFFPAIASDASGATIGSAVADTRGQVWLILKAFLIALLPLLMVSAAMVGMESFDAIGDISDLSMWSALPRIMLAGAIGFLTQAASVVMAARLFDWIGDRVKGGAQNQVG